MTYAIEPAAAPLCGPFRVPPSKSEHQRCLVLAHLADGPVEIRSVATGRSGEDVAALAAALERLRPSLSGRRNLRLDLGEGATGFRYVLALATLRPSGARTLVTGRPGLRSREHGTLLRALRGLGGHLILRRSGAVRVIAGGMQGGVVRLDPTVSSQFASTLMLLAPSLGGLEIRLSGRAASRPYLRLSAGLLSRFGLEAQLEGLDGEAGLISVPAGVPRVKSIEVAPDASCAAAWWAAVALRGGEAVVPGLGLESPQADIALLPLLPRMGVQVDRTASGDARVRASGARLLGLGPVDLTDAPDLVFLLGVLAAAGRGETILHGVGATRGKESDRPAVLVNGLRALGADACLLPDDTVRIRGGGLRAGVVNVQADHRAAFAFGILGLLVPGVRLVGRVRAVAKSHPAFLEDLARLGGERSGLA